MKNASEANGVPQSITLPHLLKYSAQSRIVRLKARANIALYMDN